MADGFPRKRFNLGWLINLRRMFIFLFLAVIAYKAWPDLSPSTYGRFNLFIRLLFYPDAFRLAVQSYLKGFQIHPILRIVELAVIAAAIWKLIFRGYIRAFLRVNSVVMLTLATLWIYLILFTFIDIRQYPIWGDLLVFFSYSPLCIYLYPFGFENATVVYVVLMVLVVCYVFTKILSGAAVSDGERLDRDEMEKLGIEDVMSHISFIRKISLRRPRFYVTDSFEQNAYCAGRNIAIAMDIFNEGIEAAQGVIAHELGHYYHYDSASRMICNTCINTVALPITAVSAVLRVLSHIPFLGILAVVSSIMIGILGVFTGLVFNIINMVFYWIDGKWAERSADLFAVDLGFGFGNFMFLSKYADRFSLKVFISGFFDVHPGTRSRCRYIRKRIIRNWGEDYWDGLVSSYAMEGCA